MKIFKKKLGVGSFALVLALLAIVAVVISLLTCSFSTFAADKQDDIVILYENDVHCEVEGYY